MQATEVLTVTDVEPPSASGLFGVADLLCSLHSHCTVIIRNVRAQSH